MEPGRAAIRPADALTGDRLPPAVAAALRRWGLAPDGALLETPSSWILPVCGEGAPAVLKVARTADERRGYGLMQWWAGQGAAAVLASAPGVLLLERATGRRDLAAMARAGQDDEATRILCRTAGRLHQARPGSVPELHPLPAWFQPLFDMAGRDSSLARAAAAASRLLAEPRSIGPLHGDLHHGNVLDFGARGWLAIDPHGLLGERCFDYANIFTNPDLDDPAWPVATLPGRLEARLAIVAATAPVEPGRMLQWIVAWTGLSAAWFIGDGNDEGAAIDLTINRAACGLIDV
ncbi:streptomycin 6-kinase [Stella humosa]|uniref:Streptomycin 6-kinase n=1 Tax=Stella humosa TaxID=94 RepID=A0A3N1M7U7_9PROT|nr:aminoglycoside phosphotransferase family protein [Stella humosa]ROP99767.1 streptomycin 6-kinase [Stella humosa]BBK31006.1 streptomycin 3''-kinase [Stella humosa]